MNEFTSALRTLLKRRRQIFLFQRIHVDGVALHPAAERSEAQCQRCFRHAVTGDETFRLETAWRETVRKAREDVRTDHVAADTGHAPARKIDPLDGGGLRAAGAKLDRKSTRLNSSH